jgi:hypothetical protein
MTTQRVARWLVVAWVSLIYSTLSVARVASNWLRDHGVLRYTVGGIFGGALLVLLGGLLRQARFRSWRLAPALVLIAALGGLVAWPSDTPEERLHLVEYGGLALLWHLALPSRWVGWRRGALALLATLACGWCDELIQALLPTRHYDLHDVLLNAASGAWALTGREVLLRAMPAVKKDEG